MVGRYRIGIKVQISKTKRTCATSIVELAVNPKNSVP